MTAKELKKFLDLVPDDAKVHMTHQGGGSSLIQIGDPTSGWHIILQCTIKYNPQ